MPTTKPRLQITLSQESGHVVTELARLSGTSKAAVVTGLLDSALPGLLQAIELMRAAEGATAKIHQHLGADLLQGMKALEAERNQLIEAIGHATKKIKHTGATTRAVRTQSGTDARGGAPASKVRGKQGKLQLA
jgi:hypothetical protein